MLEAYSVTELTTTIRFLLESSDTLQDVWVQGEVSNMTRASSGHWYFTIKDAGAQLKCAMWRSSVERQSFTPQTGDAVQVHGRIGVYEPRGEYQLYADRVRPVGIGDLYAQFEQLKARLEAEGLFAPERKRPLPPFPRLIGVVTSPEAAAFQDIQNVLRRRFPLARLILSPTLVQGQDAPPQIAAALERLNRHTDADVILLIRGGGSLEDLWAFNDERVARAVAASRIPVVAGVGHETDFTIADFVADLRAPTPSAAAEIITPDVADLRAGLAGLAAYLDAVMAAQIDQRRADVAQVARTLRSLSPALRIRSLRQRIDDRSARLLSGQQARLALLRERLKARSDALHAANPQAILKRGYAIVSRSADGVRLSRAADAPPGTALTIQLHDGEIKTRVEDKETHERYPRTLF